MAMISLNDFYGVSHWLEPGLCFHKHLSVQLGGGGGVTPNVSWDMSHGHRGGGRWMPPSLLRSGHLPPAQTWPPPAPSSKGHWPDHLRPCSDLTTPNQHTGTTVNGRAVRILLVCILVGESFRITPELGWDWGLLSLTIRFPVPSRLHSMSKSH